MAVKCFTESQKDTIVELYQRHGSIPDLVVAFRRSDTTIYRVLEERGCAPVSRRKKKKTVSSNPVQAQPTQQLPLFTNSPAYLSFKAQLPAILPNIGKPYAPKYI